MSTSKLLGASAALNSISGGLQGLPPLGHRATPGRLGQRTSCRRGGRSPCHSSQANRRRQSAGRRQSFCSVISAAHSPHRDAARARRRGPRRSRVRTARRGLLRGERVSTASSRSDDKLGPPVLSRGTSAHCRAVDQRRSQRCGVSRYQVPPHVVEALREA